MSEPGLSISAVSAAGVHVPVRPIDPVRRRFPTADETAHADNQAPRTTAANEDESAAARSRSSRGANAARGGFGSLVGAFTSFLATMFAQPEAQPAANAEAGSAGAMQAGIAAYARTANAPVSESWAVEVLAPSLPKLSSGRALDLSV